MKILIRVLIIFIILFHNLCYADTLNPNDLDDFICSYYESIMEIVDILIDKEEYEPAEKEIEPLYNSKCRTQDVASKYLHILYKLRKYKEAYPVAIENNLLDTKDGILIQANNYITVKDFSVARSVYDNILIESPYDKFAQMGLTHSYISTGSEMAALEELANLGESDEIKLIKAKAFYNLEMYEDSYKLLKSIVQTDEVIELENEIKRKRAYQFISGYELYIQKLNEEYKLDMNKFAISNSCYAKNMQVFLDYIMYIYTSGIYPGQGPEPFDNFTNEIRLGSQGRLTQKIALRGDIGVKVFQYYGAMLLTDSWIKYFINDAMNIKLGFSRNNSEQTFLSAVGVKIDNKFTGQVANNNVYLDATMRLPYRGYVFGKVGGGLKEGYNIQDNFYWEGMGGIGKLLRFEPQKPLLQKISLDIVSYNSGYHKNLENIYDSQGLLYGNYFSPKWYSDNTVNFNIAGQIKNRLAYGAGTFEGWQFAVKQHQSFFIWGASVYGKCRVNDHINCELQYRYYKYANVTRNQLIFDLVISIFKKENT